MSTAVIPTAALVLTAVPDKGENDVKKPTDLYQTTCANHHFKVQHKSTPVNNILHM